MKKSIALLLMTMMVFGIFTACSSTEKKEDGTKLASDVNSDAVTDNSTEKNNENNSENINKEPFRIGIIQPVDHPSLNQIRETIISELKAQGYGEDEIIIDLQNANGDTSLLPTIYQNLISNDVDLLIPIATSTAQAAFASTTTIPIVFSAVSNPVEAGLVPALDSTTGNVTGVSDYIAVEDIFALAMELTPEVKTFGFIYNTSEINSVAGVERAKAYCKDNGLAYKEATVTATSELQQAATSLIGDIDAFFTPIDNTVASAMPTYAQIANDANLPIYVSADSMVIDGGLATVGIDYTVLGRQTAQMAIRIMNGETVEENPVEQIAEYAKMINMKTAKLLDITVPENIQDEFVILAE